MQKQRLKKVGESYVWENEEFITRYEVDGKETSIKYKEVVQFSEIPKVFVLENKTRALKFVAKDGGELSPETYYRLSDELHKVNDDGNFNNIDDEYAYRKFKENYTPILENYFERIPVEFDVIEFPETENKMLTPIRKITGELKDPLFQCDYSIVELFRSIAKEYNFVELPMNTSHEHTKGLFYAFHRDTSLEYLVINGKYLPDCFYKMNLRCVGTEEECVDKINVVSEGIRKYLRGISVVVSSPLFNREMVLEEMETILKYAVEFNSLTNRRKKCDKFDMLLKKIRGLIEDLKN